MPTQTAENLKRRSDWHHEGDSGVSMYNNAQKPILKGGPAWSLGIKYYFEDLHFNVVAAGPSTRPCIEEIADATRLEAKFGP